MSHAIGRMPNTSTLSYVDLAYLNIIHGEPHEHW